jgi:hypothetical protein
MRISFSSIVTVSRSHCFWTGNHSRKNRQDHYNPYYRQGFTREFDEFVHVSGFCRLTGAAKKFRSTGRRD